MPMHHFYERTLKWVLDRELLMLIVTLVVIVATVGSTSTSRKDFSRNRTPAS